MQHSGDRKSMGSILISWTCDSNPWHADIEIAELVQLLGLPEPVTPVAPSQVQAPLPEQKGIQGENSTPDAETPAKE
jgi:hypothetical protein